jgi:hypothetical protein
MTRLFKTERYWIDDAIVQESKVHASLEEAQDYIKTIQALDPDEKLTWNLLEIIFHGVAA